MKKEGLIPFPALRRSIAAPVARIADGFTASQDVCGFWPAPNERTAKFVHEFAAHAHLENDVPLPRFGQLVGSRGQTKGHVS